MKKLFYLMVVLSIIVMSSCSPDTPANPTTSSVSVKYEIILSSPLIPISPTILTPIRLLYTNGTAQYEFAYDFNYGSSSWTKTVNMTAARPCGVNLEVDGLYMNTPGTITANIYINGVVKATQTNPTQNSSGINFGIVQLVYLIQ